MIVFYCESAHYCPYCGSSYVYEKGSPYFPAIVMVCGSCGAEWIEEEALP